MQYRIKDGKVSKDGIVYAVGDIIDLDPEIAAKFPVKTLEDARIQHNVIVEEPGPGPEGEIPEPAKRGRRKGGE